MVLNRRISADLRQRGGIENGRIVKCLDDAWQRLTSGGIGNGMQHLAESLQDIRATSNAADWKAAVTHLCRSHGIFATLLLDPFTARSFYKPRGYSGDAILLDLIYGFGQRDALLNRSSETGRLIYQYSSNRFGPHVVRWRCRHVAQRIDDLAQRFGHLRILSIASGHARELNYSRAAQNGGIAEFVALDADRRTLETFAQWCNGVPITTIAAEAKTLLTGAPDLGSFDFVYSLGLFDYLPGRIASRLLAAIAKLLRPGGQALIANFSPRLPDAGYMEAFMDWWLLYRDEHELRTLGRDAGLHCVDTYSDPMRCLALLTFVRRG